MATVHGAAKTQVRLGFTPEGDISLCAGLWDGREHYLADEGWAWLSALKARRLADLLHKYADELETRKADSASGGDAEK